MAVAPPSPVTVTVTSNNGTIATITKDGTVAGGTSLTFTNVTSTTVGTIFVQGRALGTTTLTVQAAGYNDGTSNVTVDPSGFILNMGNFTTTTSAANTTLQSRRGASSHPTTLNYSQSQPLRGGLTVNVPVTSSDYERRHDRGQSGDRSTPATSLNFGTAFDPAAVGTTTISCRDAGRLLDAEQLAIDHGDGESMTGGGEPGGAYWSAAARRRASSSVGSGVSAPAYCVMKVL